MEERLLYPQRYVPPRPIQDDSAADEAPEGTILFVDAYDSFSNNIISLLETSLRVKVEVVKIDCRLNPLHDPTFLCRFDAIVVGPGPGNPLNVEDIGFVKELWSLDDQSLLPILGICLGFQSLAHAFGATIDRLSLPSHGMVGEVLHNSTSIFKDADQIIATRYHSLHANIKHPIQGHGTVAFPSQIWHSTDECPDLVPLAWDLNDLSNGAVLMALCHKNKPFWGLQYHPESICTSQSSNKVIQNWWEEVKSWNLAHGRAPLAVAHNCNDAIDDTSPKITDDGSIDAVAGQAKSPHPLVKPAPARLDDENDHGPTSDKSMISTLLAIQDSITFGASPHERSRAALASEEDEDPQLSCPFPGTSTFLGREIPFYTGGSFVLSTSLLLDPDVFPDLSGVQIIDALKLKRTEVLLLDSAAKRPETGTHSVIGMIIPNRTIKIQYVAHSNEVRVLSNIKGQYQTRTESLEDAYGDIWAYLAHFLEERQFIGGSRKLPFWGGLVGYVSYEMGLSEITDLPTPRASHPNRPDLMFYYIERTIIIDHLVSGIYVQSLIPGDHAWINGTAERIRHWTESVDNYDTSIPSSISPRDTSNIAEYLTGAKRYYPDKQKYKAKVRDCQDHIRSGDSYELCLTAQTVFTVPKRRVGKAPCWAMYKQLRTNNPAPFAAYLPFPEVTILSSSPERFLSWSRTGTCQMRPIKGTVRKTPGMTEEYAQYLLTVPKEKAENLMIVDLIRHDLHGALGSGAVDVRKLFGVEDYETVYQLVSVIEGKIPALDWFGPKLPEELPNVRGMNKPTKRSINARRVYDTQTGLSPFGRLSGTNILAASLPPGSMTGAPKRRSCELLYELEGQQARGIYSGAIGYMCVGGSGDFAVTIRTMFKWADEERFEPGEDAIYKGRKPRPQQMNGKQAQRDVWRIGAGGAVTALSVDEAEYEEMTAKLSSTSTVFDPVPIGYSPFLDSDEYDD